MKGTRGFWKGESGDRAADRSKKVYETKPNEVKKITMIARAW
jgi:hypothetical protein